MGPNGSGKTTLGKLVMGILKPDSGEIFLDGKNLSELSLGQIGNRIGYLFQNPGLQIFTLNVEEELSFALRLKGYDEKRIKSRVGKMLELFRLSHLVGEVPFNLSYGERQRLALASILINNPRYLILDEPTVGLDNTGREILAEVLLEHVKSTTGMTVISHDEDFIKKTATRILRLEEGRIL